MLKAPWEEEAAKKDERICQEVQLSGEVGNGFAVLW